MNGNEKTVLAAMSGGVDSSVAAAMLLEAGWDVTGVFFCLGAEVGRETHERSCCSPQDAADARRAADALGARLHVEHVGEAFEPIIEDFAAEYARGRTPNPCVLCNARVKFAKLIGLADRLGVGRVATGHHARIVEYRGRAAVGRSASKDQSYALFAVEPDWLGRVLLPIGELPCKEAVRARARGLGLDLADKPDSQEICFVPDDEYPALLADRRPEALTPGPIVNEWGEEVGRHEGYARFTIGQRRGLGVSAGEPMYVTGIDPATATVRIGPREAAAGLALRASGARWQQRPNESEFEGFVQVRYNHRAQPGRVRLLDGERFDVRFDAPVHAITPGQAAVVYDGDVVLGGGWIDGP
jgi:tRNA-uridine 2-sulfurtransferase